MILIESSRWLMVDGRFVSFMKKKKFKVVCCTVFNGKVTETNSKLKIIVFGSKQRCSLKLGHFYLIKGFSSSQEGEMMFFVEFHGR